MHNPKPLKPKQLLALDVLVAGGTDLQAARAAGCGRSSIYRWKLDPQFAGELQHRTLEATESARRILGADMRASVEASMMATNKFIEIMGNPTLPPWMQLQAAQSARKNGRFAAEKLDPELRSLEAVGKNDPERKHVADEVTRAIAVWQNRDQFLAQLQEYEQRRMDERNRQHETELLRRLNIVSRHRPEQRAWLYAVWRRQDDHEESLEGMRRDKARKDFAAAAGIELKDLPPSAPFKWADLSDQFENMVKSANAPANEAEELAEIKRMQELEYVDAGSPEGKAQQEKFDAQLKATEADYRNNVMPKVAPSPIERETRSMRGMGVSPMSNDTSTAPPNSPASVSKDKGTHGPEAHATKWRGAIPDQDSPDRQAYVDSLGDDEVPQLSEADRRRKEDWDQRRKRSEENERIA